MMPYYFAVTKTENCDHVCAGGVVLKTGLLEPEVLLIQVSRVNGRLEWLLPKGHVEAGELLENAARREIHEETGISPDNLALLDDLGPIEYSFFQHGDDGQKIALHKKVYFFLYGILNQDADTLSAVAGEGIIQSGFFPVSTATDLLAFDEYLDVLARAVNQYFDGCSKL